MDNRETGPSSLFRERSELKNTILTAITVCVFSTPPSNSQIPAESPTIQLNYDTICLEILSDLTA